jgi:2-polyprenyl-3-methyl-5-hydroxy-6-metoxy-1,4-benzoquinol methylase
MKVLELHRRRTPEIMDSPSLEEGEHARALAGLRRINQVSGVGERMLRPLLAWASEARVNRATLLDVACGGGDVPVALALAAKRCGLEFELTLLDRSAVALRQADRAARGAGVTCRTVCGDVAAGLGGERFDVVTNSLFLHHLDGPEVIAALGAMRVTARWGVVVSDLRRSAAGWAAAWVGCRLLTSSRVVHFDGPVSVRGAWTVAELAAMARAAGMAGAKIARCRPWRMMLTWQGGPAQGANHVAG